MFTTILNLRLSAMAITLLLKVGISCFSGSNELATKVKMGCYLMTDNSLSFGTWHIYILWVSISS
jgi:hypothetical protein